MLLSLGGLFTLTAPIMVRSKKEAADLPHRFRNGPVVFEQSQNNRDLCLKPKSYYYNR